MDREFQLRYKSHKLLLYNFVNARLLNFTVEMVENASLMFDVSSKS